MKTEIIKLGAFGGLHARQAALLVNEASHHISDVTLEYKNGKANLKSVLGVMSLGVPQGAEVKLTVSGSDHEKAFEAIKKLIQEIQTRTYHD